MFRFLTKDKIHNQQVTVVLHGNKTCDMFALSYIGLLTELKNCQHNSDTVTHRVKCMEIWALGNFGVHVFWTGHHLKYITLAINMSNFDI